MKKRKHKNTAFTDLASSTSGLMDRVIDLSIATMLAMAIRSNEAFRKDLIELLIKHEIGSEEKDGDEKEEKC